LITWEKENQIVITTESENKNDPHFFLEEIENIIFIKSVVSNFEQNELEIDKQCSIQPIFTSYRIQIPKNKKVDISYTQGNFYADNFKGNLNLKVEEGIIKINRFEGLVNIHINIGNVYINEINNTKIDVASNMGVISSNLLIKNKHKISKDLKGVFGKSFNELNIKAILANIQLKSFKN